MKVVNGSGTELDEDVFEDVATDPSTGVLTIKYFNGWVSFLSYEGYGVY